MKRFFVVTSTNKDDEPVDCVVYAEDEKEAERIFVLQNDYNEEDDWEPVNVVHIDDFSNEAFPDSVYNRAREGEIVEI